ncbi:MAG: glycosyltransferase family 2 protein [Chloroflexi bacterium]|nr:glycosyltransferase family 2 protein [Chloroflexota bacterium]
MLPGAIHAGLCLHSNRPSAAPLAAAPRAHLTLACPSCILRQAHEQSLSLEAPSVVLAEWRAPHPGPALRPVDLSVVVLNFNTREQLRHCLRSLEAQTGIDLQRQAEVFVVDNASSDGSADMVAREFPWVRLVRSPRNGGFAYGNNLALRQCGGRFALLLNPDTVLPPTALADMLVFVGAHPQAGAAGPKMVLPDGRLDLACRRAFPTPSVALYRLLGLSRLLPQSPRFGRYNLTYLDPDLPAEVDSVMGAFMLVRREAIDQAGLLDETFFMYGEDVDWAFRIRQHGWTVLYNPAVVVLHDKGAASRQRSYAALLTFYHAMWLFYRKHFAARRSALLNALVALAIAGHCGLALVKNWLRAPHAKRVST